MMTCMKPIMLRAAIFNSSLWTGTGCSYTYTVTFEEEKPNGDTVSVATLNNRLGNRSSTIVMHDGKEHTVSDLTLTRDTSFFTGEAGEMWPCLRGKGASVNYPCLMDC
jgi:hypothetical protein